MTEHRWWSDEFMPKTVDEQWYRIDRFLLSLPGVERTKARKVLMRRLMHPEGRGVGLTEAQRDLERENNAARNRSMPRWDSPLCICGARRSAHDEIEGTTDTCEGFIPVSD